MRYQPEATIVARVNEEARLRSVFDGATQAAIAYTRSHPRSDCASALVMVIAREAEASPPGAMSAWHSRPGEPLGRRPDAISAAVRELEALTDIERRAGRSDVIRPPLPRFAETWSVLASAEALG